MVDAGHVGVSAGKGFYDYKKQGEHVCEVEGKAGQRQSK